MAALQQAAGHVRSADFGAASWAAESTGTYDGALTLTLENDVFTGSDNNYTNGLGISWVSNDIDTYDEKSLVRRWVKFWSFLPFVGDKGSRTYIAWSIAQEMHTPDEIEDPNPPLDDQPYAGVVCLDSVVYAKNERWAHAWQLRVGVVGPASHADDVQRWFHDVTGNPKPQGWSTQLPNELVVNVGYTGSYLLARGIWAVRLVAGDSGRQRRPGQLFHRRRGGSVRRDRLEPRRRTGRNSAAPRLQCRVDRGCRAVEGLVGVLVRRHHGLRGRALSAAGRHRVQGQPLRRHGAFHRHGHAGPVGAAQQLRLLPRPDTTSPRPSKPSVAAPSSGQ